MSLNNISLELTGWIEGMNPHILTIAVGDRIDLLLVCERSSYVDTKHIGYIRLLDNEIIIYESLIKIDGVFVPKYPLRIDNVFCSADITHPSSLDEIRAALSELIDRNSNDNQQQSRE